MTERDSRPATRLISGGRSRAYTGALVNPPVHRASTILFDDVAHLRRSDGAPGKLYYGRQGTPSQWALADALTDLEPGAAGTTLHPSGVAAITTALLALLVPGDELLMVDSTYEPTRVFCETTLKRIGVKTLYYDPSAGADAVAALFTDKTRALFLESPGSLTFEVQDVPGLCAAAKARGIVTLLDNSWATPLLFPAIAHGVDIALLACTKYVVGHSDAMLGSATCAPGVIDRMRRTTRGLGQCVSPDDAFLGLRGLRTMGVRLKAHEANGLEVARWLKARPEVGAMLHPAFPDCPGHDLWQRDFSGASGLFAFELAGADDAMRVRFVDALRHFGIGFSWGGFESLVLPIDPARIRGTGKMWGGGGPLVRLHIGLEDPADLIADLTQAFAKMNP